jgi:hypothetical protein
MNVAEITQLLQEMALRHGVYEAMAPPHDWWDWYAAYYHARQNGSTPHEASTPLTATWRR